LSRIFVGLSASTFGVLGILFVIWPTMMASYVDIHLVTSMAITDVRATYGGFQIAVSGFLFYCLLNQKVLLALLFAGVGALGFGIARGLGLALDYPPHPLMVKFFVLEMVFGLSSLTLWLKQR